MENERAADAPQRLGGGLLETGATSVPCHTPVCEAMSVNTHARPSNMKTSLRRKRFRLNSDGIRRYFFENLSGFDANGRGGT